MRVDLFRSFLVNNGKVDELSSNAFHKLASRDKKWDLRALSNEVLIFAPFSA